MPFDASRAAARDIPDADRNDDALAALQACRECLGDMDGCDSFCLWRFERLVDHCIGWTGNRVDATPSVAEVRDRS